MRRLQAVPDAPVGESDDPIETLGALFEDIRLMIANGYYDAAALRLGALAFEHKDVPLPGLKS